MLRVAIIDDEAPARASLRAALGGLSMPMEVVGEAHDVPSAIALIDEQRPDLVLLDIWLGNGTGFDVLDGVAFRDVRVVFVTAYDQYAVRAFNSGAVHYLLKPVVRKDLQTALERVSAAPPRLADVEELRRSMLERITVPTAEGFHVIDPAEVVRCESDGNYTRLYLADDERVLASRTLKEFEELLVPHGFMRVHLSHLVNMAQVRRYLHRDGGVLVLGNGAEVPVSHRRRQAVIASLGKRPGEE